MNDNLEFEQLDKLLAQPALLADKGFSEKLNHRFNKLNTARRNVFLVTGLSWFVLMIITVSPQALFANLYTLAMAMDISSVFIYLGQQYQSFNLTNLQSSYSTVAVITLSVAAVLSMAVRA